MFVYGHHVSNCYKLQAVTRVLFLFLRFVMYLVVFILCLMFYSRRFVTRSVIFMFHSFVYFDMEMRLLNTCLGTHHSNFFSFKSVIFQAGTLFNCQLYLPITYVLKNRNIFYTIYNYFYKLKSNSKHSSWVLKSRSDVLQVLSSKSSI